jgi:hypothetical protein
MRAVRHVVTVTLFLATAASAQTIYRWTDARGTVHFTDDPANVPAGAKVSTTQGEELSEMGQPARLTAPSPRPGAPVEIAQASTDAREEDYWRGLFRDAHEKVRELEDELAADSRWLGDPTGMGIPITCPRGYGGYAYGSGGYGYGFVNGASAAQAGSVGGSATLPLGNGATLSVNGSAGASARQSTVTPFAGYAPYVSYPGYGYGPGYGCWVVAEQARVRDRIDRTKMALARAREELADLERRAAFNAVPLEWRR